MEHLSLIGHFTVNIYRTYERYLLKKNLSLIDSTYTERFMGPYHENRHKYEIVREYLISSV